MNYTCFFPFLQYTCSLLGLATFPNSLFIPLPAFTPIQQVFYSCGLSLSDGDMDMVEEMCEDTWENLKHLYMTIDQKEAAKSIFGFNSVPFCVCFDASGALVAKGDPKTIDFNMCLSAAPKVVDTPTLS